MIYTVLTSMLLLAPQEPAAAVQATIPEAAKLLQDALKSKDTALAIDALLMHGKRADPSITKVVGFGFKQKSSQVLGATIQALRFNPDPSALTELLKVKRQKKIVEDLELGPQYYIALGQHGKSSAFAVLSKSLRTTKGAEAKLTEARILAIGRLREVRSIEVLLKLQRSGGGGGRGGRGGSGRGPHRNQVQMALMALTGEDPGSTTLDWSQWWSDNKRGFRLSKKEEFPDSKLKKQWERTWAAPKAAGEGKGDKKDRRKDRKNDRKTKRKKAGEKGQGDSDG